MLNYNELRPGVIFILDGQPYEVLEYNFLRKQQRKPVVQTKIKNLISGKIINQTFHQGETFKEAEIEKEKAKYLYSHRDHFVFCYEDNPSKRFELSASQLDSTLNYLKPNTIAEALFFNKEIINIELPVKMDFEVIEAPPSIKGDTASGGTKVVTIETGTKINAPLFIEVGDTIRVNTQTGEYAERIEKRRG